MTLHGFPLLPLLAIAAGGVALVIVLYTARWRLPQRVVASTAFWLQVVGRKRGAGRLGRVEQLLSLVVQLVIFGGLLLAIGQPRLAWQSPAGRAVMVVLDRSSSMNTQERIELRIDIAKRRALERIARAASGDLIGLLLSGGDPEIAVPLGNDRAALREELQKVGVRAGPGHLHEAVARACSFLRGHAQASLVVVTDGTESVEPCADAAVEWITVGAARPNLGITALQTALPPRDPLHAEAFVEVLNAATSRVTAELRLDLDGSLLRVATIDLDPGQKIHRIFEGIPLTGVGRLVARLTRIQFADGQPDALADDDVGYAVVEHRATVAVDLLGASVPVSMALSSNPRYRVNERHSLDEASGAITVVVGDVPGPLGPGRYLLVNPKGRFAPVEIGAPVANPVVTYHRDEHPILRRVVMTDVYFDQASTVRLPASATALVGSSATPLLFAMVDGGRRIVGLTFDVEASNFPLRVGFPVLLYNAIDWLTQASADSNEASLTLRTREPVVVRAPQRAPQTLSPIEGHVLIERGAPGFYEVSTQAGQRLRTFAVSVSDPEETQIAPHPQPTLSAGVLAGRWRDRELSPWLLALVLTLLLVEWVTFHRRKTV